MAEFIEILSPSALKDLQTANTEVLTLIKNIDNAGKSMQNIKTPSGSDSSVKNLNENLTTFKNNVEQVDKVLKKNVQTILDQSKSYQSLAKQKEVSIKQLEREQAKLEASLSLQAKTTAQLKKVQFAYDELALKKQRYNNLSDNEEKRLVTLTSTLQKYRTIQDGVNTTVGKFQQRVGNYATAFNPLSNSINQLSREMPAFANSVQTGFMAISNNLPIFFDAMENAIAQQKELQKQGLPSKNALQLLAGSFFTLGTALSLGVTALTIFGPMLIKAITNSEQKTKAIEAEKKAREEQLQVEKQHFDAQSKYASDEQARAKIGLENAKNTTLPLKERLKFVDELRQRYPDYLGLLSKEEILAGDTADAEYRLNDALMKRALFLAVQDRIKETTKELVDAEFKYLEAQTKSIANQAIYDKELEKTTNTKKQYRLVTEQEANSTDYLKKVEEDRNKSLAKGNVVQLNSTDVLRKNTIATRDKLEILYKILNENAKYNDVVVEETKRKKNNTKAKREDVEVLQETSKSYDSLLYKLEKNKSMLEEMQKATSRSSSEWRFYQEAIDKVSRSIDILKNGFPELKESAKAVTDGLELQYKQAEANAKSLADLKKATDEYISSFSSGFLSNAGLGAFDTFFKDIGNGVTEFQQRLESLKQSGADTSQIFALYFESIAEGAQQAFNKIIELSNQRFQNELVNLEREKEIAILFAGESASAREEIERQYEARQRDIKNREARAKKGQALFNIAIDIAQGIVSALASGNIPLSIAIGAIGAIQLGLVASQPIPQFATGTDNAPEGFALTQEKGAEIITDKSGKIKTLGNNKGAQMTYLSKGDKVFTAEQSSQLMHNQALNSILTSSGIMPTQILNNSTNVDMSGVINAIENKPSVINQVDQSGFRQLITNGHTTKENMNRRITGTSYGV